MRTFVAGSVLAAFTAFPVFASAAVDGPRTLPSAPAAVSPQAASVATVVPDQFIDAQQLQIDTVVGVGSPQSSLHRTITAWQIGTGRWNGQILDGLSLVLVQNPSNDPANTGDVAIYISDFATTAQRAALMAAMSSSHPSLFVMHDGCYRIEPASIRVEQINGGPLVLHVGLIAMADTNTPHSA